MHTDATLGRDEGPPGPGHNIKGEEVVWERWTRKRVFVRALEGTYGNLVKELFTQPRVYKSRDLALEGRAAVLRQEDHQPAVGQDRAVDRDPYRGVSRPAATARGTAT